MPSPREQMNEALKETVIPFLRQRGFKGSLPHFRRPNPDSIDLLTFQFDRHGGGFVVEIAKCSPDGYTRHFGTHCSPAKVSAWDLPPDSRYRIQPRGDGSADNWFRYDKSPGFLNRDIYTRLANQVVLLIDTEAEDWWRNADPVSSA